MTRRISRQSVEPRLNAAIRRIRDIRTSLGLPAKTDGYQSFLWAISSVVKLLSLGGRFQDTVKILQGMKDRVQALPTTRDNDDSALRILSLEFAELTADRREVRLAYSIVIDEFCIESISQQTKSVNQYQIIDQTESMAIETLRTKRDQIQRKIQLARRELEQGEGNSMTE